MNIHINYNDRFRVDTNQGKIFVDVTGLRHEAGICVEALSHYTYIEIREKSGQIATFYFSKKSDKKSAELEWWQDAEVIFSKNNVSHK